MDGLPPHYQVDCSCLLGSGNFGKVYKALNTSTGEEVAVKIAAPDALIVLRNEYQTLKGIDTRPFGWRIIEYGSNGFLVMSLLGDNLETLLRLNGGNFSLKTVLMIAEQVLIQLERYHRESIVHRDLKPSNLLVSTGNQEHICLVDFGLSKKYRHTTTTSTTHPSCVGTLRYMTLNAIHRREQTYIDDLVSFGYVMIFMLLGKLPWQGNCRKEIIAIKERTTIDELVEDLSLPERNTFRAYFQILSATSPQTHPLPHLELRQLFQNLMRRCCYAYDWQWDWNRGTGCPP